MKLYPRYCRFCTPGRMCPFCRQREHLESLRQAARVALEQMLVKVRQVRT